jgi:hypothetical protein
MAQVQKVMFSFHAAQRLNQRLGTRISTEHDVDISTAFRKVGEAYRHYNGAMVQSYVPRDTSVRMLMIVSVDTRCVLTVMAEGPVVDAVYRKIAH